MIGYTPSGYIFLRPEEGNFYGSRDVHFNEKILYGDKFKKDEIKNWYIDTEVPNEKDWFINFETDKHRNEEGLLKPEGEISKRKRGRPR